MSAFRSKKNIFSRRPFSFLSRYIYIFECKRIVPVRARMNEPSHHLVDLHYSLDYTGRRSLSAPRSIERIAPRVRTVTRAITRGTSSRRQVKSVDPQIRSLLGYSRAPDSLCHQSWRTRRGGDKNQEEEKRSGGVEINGKISIFLRDNRSDPTIRADPRGFPTRGLIATSSPPTLP